jgi:hypothetical protein
MKFLSGMVYCIPLAAVLISLISFSVTRHHIYLYMGIGSILLIPIYTGYFRRRIRKQFNIRASISWDKPFSDIVFRKFPVYWKSQDVAIIAVASVLVFYRIVPSLTLLQVYLSVAPSYVVNFNVLLLLTLLMLDEISFREWFTAFC